MLGLLWIVLILPPHVRARLWRLPRAGEARKRRTSPINIRSRPPLIKGRAIVNVEAKGSALRATKKRTTAARPAAKPRAADGDREGGFCRCWRRRQSGRNRSPRRRWDRYAVSAFSDSRRNRR